MSGKIPVKTGLIVLFLCAKVRLISTSAILCAELPLRTVPSYWVRINALYYQSSYKKNF